METATAQGTEEVRYVNSLEEGYSQELAHITNVTVGYGHWQGLGMRVSLRMLVGGSCPWVSLQFLEEYLIEDANSLVGATCVVSVAPPSEGRTVKVLSLHTRADGTDFKRRKV